SRFDQVLAEIRAMREESERKWEENKRQWEENQEVIRELIKQDKKIERTLVQTIGALGARWGISTETSFRNALRAILEESFGVKVEHVQYRDESREVYDRPDQVELDVIIRNGQVLVCEIKASASRSDIYTFNRKVLSYEKRTQRKVDRKLLISPMVLSEDQKLAQELGIEVYSSTEQVAL
ncbi:MAG: PD-(D/E)XK nuclease family protein, partial [Anaerolineales bacterium]